MPGTIIDAISPRSPSASAHAPGSPSKALGVTPKVHIAPANRTSAEGTSSMRFSAICPPVGTAQASGLSQADGVDGVGDRAGA